jgi:hypothetical protein
MEQLIYLKSLAPKRDGVLLVCSLVCAGLLRGWWQSLGFVGALVFGRQLLSAWSWKRRFQPVQRIQIRRPFEIYRYTGGELFAR